MYIHTIFVLLLMPSPYESLKHFSSYSESVTGIRKRNNLVTCFKSPNGDYDMPVDPGLDWAPYYTPL